jgi:hypothetical protein
MAKFVSDKKTYKIETKNNQTFVSIDYNNQDFEENNIKKFKLKNFRAYIVCFVIVHYKKINTLIIIIIILNRLFYINDSLCCSLPLNLTFEDLDTKPPYEIWGTSPTSEDELPKFSSRDEMVGKAKEIRDKNFADNALWPHTGVGVGTVRGQLPDGSPCEATATKLSAIGVTLHENDTVSCKDSHERVGEQYTKTFQKKIENHPTLPDAVKTQDVHEAYKSQKESKKS